MTVILEARHVSFHYRTRTGERPILKDVSLALLRGETLALVGESGSGKTTLGRVLARLLEPQQGEVILEGVDITHLGRKALRPHRHRIQMIFQDPQSALNPRKTIAALLDEPLRVHGALDRAERRQRAIELLGQVGLSAESLTRFPHELSGGQRQRVMIARALAPEPDVIVCDEAVSSLDVSVRVQIINLLARLQQRMKLTYLFITHDLMLVRHFADRVAVMREGRIVELGESRSICESPTHPYTRELLEAAPALPARGAGGIDPAPSSAAWRLEGVSK